LVCSAFSCESEWFLLRGWLWFGSHNVYIEITMLFFISRIQVRVWVEIHLLKLLHWHMTSSSRLLLSYGIAKQYHAQLLTDDLLLDFSNEPICSCREPCPHCQLCVAWIMWLRISLSFSSTRTFNCEPSRFMVHFMPVWKPIFWINSEKVFLETLNMKTTGFHMQLIGFRVIILSDG